MEVFKRWVQKKIHILITLVNQLQIKLMNNGKLAKNKVIIYSTVTDLARLRGLSTSIPLAVPT